MTFKLLLLILELTGEVSTELLDGALVLGLTISDLCAEVKVGLLNLGQPALKVFLLAHELVDYGPGGHKFAGKKVPGLEVSRSHQIQADVPQMSKGRPLVNGAVDVFNTFVCVATYGAHEFE